MFSLQVRLLCLRCIFLYDEVPNSFPCTVTETIYICKYYLQHFMYIKNSQQKAIMEFCSVIGAIIIFSGLLLERNYNYNFGGNLSSPVSLSTNKLN